MHFEWLSVLTWKALIVYSYLMAAASNCQSERTFELIIRNLSCYASYLAQSHFIFMLHKSLNLIFRLTGFRRQDWVVWNPIRLFSVGHTVGVRIPMTTNRGAYSSMPFMQQRPIKWLWLYPKALVSSRNQRRKWEACFICFNIAKRLVILLFWTDQRIYWCLVDRSRRRLADAVAVPVAAAPHLAALQDASLYGRSARR